MIVFAQITTPGPYFLFSIHGNVKKMTSKPSQLNIEGKIIDDDKELTTKFNNLFVNVGTNTEKTIPKVPNISSSHVIAHISLIY